MLASRVETLLLLFKIFAVLSQFTKPFSSFFHQSDYNVDFEWIEVVRFNKDNVKQFHAVAFKYNRTTTAFNITQHYKIDMGYNLEIILQAYKFTSNEYRLFPAIRFELNACKSTEEDLVGFKRLLNCGNFTGCPLLKERTYYSCNFVPDSSRLPPRIPSGRYKIEAQGLYRDEELWLTNGYLKVHRQFDKK